MTISELAAWFSDKDDIAVISHISPDGDAVGSALAMTLAFKQMGKRACAVLADPVPQKYMFLPGADEVCTPDSVPFYPRCAFTVDISEKSRMGSAIGLFDAAECRAVLDHHETNEGFGDACHVEGDRASTGEIALEVIKAMGAKITKDIAENIFVALNTDTGNFNYKNTDRRAFMAAAECAEYGARVQYLTLKAFRERTLNCTLLLGEALSRAKTMLNGKIAYTYVDNAMLAKTGATLEDADHIANYMSEVSGVMVGVYFEQQKDNTKISWRAAGEVNVAEIAVQFGGGGHDAAAGANVYLPMEETMKAVLEKTAEVVKGYDR